MERSRLYNLTPQEFERFIAELLPKAGYADVRLTGGPGDRGIDLIATRDGKTVAFQVKHKTRLSQNDIQQFARRYFADPTVPRSLILVTSAVLPPDVATVAASIPPGSELGFLDRTDIQRIVSAHPGAAQRWFGEASKRLSQQRYLLWISALAAIVSLVASVFSLFPITSPPKEPLDKRIETVQRVLSSIRELEAYLTAMKDDMTATKKAITVINQKYAQAKELEKLTNQQTEALQATLQAQTWGRILLNYALGFLLGIASSFIASILHTRWRQRKALE